MADSNSTNSGAADLNAPQNPAVLTTRPATRRHSTELRGLTSVPSSTLFSGRFGRIFRSLPVFSHDERHLRALAAKMVAQLEDPPTPEGEVDEEETTKPIPAGFTYLGQVIDHDLTFDTVATIDRQNDLEAR